MAKVFISYGGPDQGFAAKVNKSLKRAGIETYFFPDNSLAGNRLHHEMRDNIERSDRVLLICSKYSLDRLGVTNEIEETLAREQALGGRALLIPITLDNHIFNDWKPKVPGLALSIQRRVIADFRNSESNSRLFKANMNRVIDAALSDFPVLHISYSNHVVIHSVDGKQASSKISKSLIVNKGVLNKYSFNDLDATGTLHSFTSKMGRVVIKKVGGATTAEVIFHRSFQTGEIVNLDLTMQADDCYTEVREDLRSRIVSPYKEFKLRATLPASRAAKTIFAFTNLSERTSKLIPIMYTSDSTDFGLEVNFPALGSYFNLEWEW